MYNQAKQFAISKHGSQKYGEVPYIIHLNHVVSVLGKHGYANDDANVRKFYLKLY